MVIAWGTAGLGHSQPNTGTTGQIGRRLSTCRGSSPSTVSRYVVIVGLVSTACCDRRERGVVVRVESVLLHLFPPLFLGGLFAFPLAPEPQSSQNEDCDRYDGHHYGDRNGTTSRQAGIIIAR